MGGMADAKAEFIETLKRLLLVPRYEPEAEERKWRQERVWNA